MNCLKSLFFLLVTIMLISCSGRKNDQAATPIQAPEPGSIFLSDAQVQLANISTASAVEGSIGHILSLTGVMKVDEQTAITVSSRTPGRILKLYYKSTGEAIKQGDKLYDFYSDDLIAAQKEYFNLQSHNWNPTGRYEPSLNIENKLIIMGMLPDQIRELGKNGRILFSVPVYSTCEGKVRSVNVAEGQYINPGDVLFELASDEKLWLEAQVYPNEIEHLRTGMPATAIIPLAGDIPVKCTVNFINPSFEQGKNVMLVRAVIDNPSHMLHPGMMAVLKIRTRPEHGVLIPSSAVISESDGDIVWVRDENGAFSARKVITGMQTDDSVLVLSGIRLSENVVSSGAYLLNSELVLKQGTALQSPESTGSQDQDSPGYDKN